MDGFSGIFETLIGQHPAGLVLLSAKNVSNRIRCIRHRGWPASDHRFF
jgi:hypothetical protein